MEKDNDEEANAIIEHLLETGAMEVLGFDEPSNSFTYKITEKCKEIYPDLYDAHFSYVGDLAMDMWQKDLVDIIFTESGPTIGMTVEQFDYAKENMHLLTDDERLFLEAIISHYEDGV